MTNTMVEATLRKEISFIKDNSSKESLMDKAVLNIAMDNLL